MNLITFPGLNIKFNIAKVAFKIFGIEIFWYAILIVIAMIVALFLFKKREGLYGIKFDDILDFSLYVIPVAIISARLYYIVFNIEYYLKNPIEMLNIRNGGLAIYGAVIGGAITSLIFCKKRKINILDLLDYIIPGVVLGQAIGRWGNFINIEAYGTKTEFLLRMGIIENGTYIEVHPTFLYESIACFWIFVILIIIKNKRNFKGQIVYTYLALYSLQRFFVEGLRTDSLMLGNIRVSQLLSALIFAVSVTIYSVNMLKLRK